jgi:RNA polymerase sigma-70 factor, ECF subfamily
MARDNEDFTMIFNEIYPGLCRFLECLLGGRTAGASAEDIAQESFMRFYRQDEASIPAAEARFWLYRVARNLALNELGRGRTRQRFWGKVLEIFHARPGGPLEELEQIERKEILSGLLKALPEQHRAALLLRELEEMSYREIARVLEISESKVKVDIYRARSALRAGWRERESAS